MDESPGGWPDKDRPGVPANAAAEGWHWLHDAERGEPRLVPGRWAFCPGVDRWEWMVLGCIYAAGAAGRFFSYAGPCLPPAEAAAREAAAWCAGREAAAAQVDCGACNGSESRPCPETCRFYVAQQVRALAPPPTLAAALAAAGLVLVPAEATADMTLAANKAVAVATPDGTWALARDEASRAWRAMVAAASERGRAGR